MKASSAASRRTYGRQEIRANSPESLHLNFNHLGLFELISRQSLSKLCAARVSIVERQQGDKKATMLS